MSRSQTPRALGTALVLSAGLLLLVIAPMAHNFMTCGSVFLCGKKDRCSMSPAEDAR
jgi:hypothetical protein